MKFRFRVQVGSRYTHCQSGIELDMLVRDLISGHSSKDSLRRIGKVALEDIHIKLERAPEKEEQEWFEEV